MRKKKSLADKLDKIIQDSVVEYDKPKENGEIGTVLGVPVFIKLDTKR